MAAWVAMTVALTLMASSALDFTNTERVARHIQQRVAQTKLALKSSDSSKVSEAVKLIEETQRTLESWKKHIKKGQKPAKSAPSKKSNNVHATDRVKELKVKRTHIPDNCSNKAEMHDRLSVHYVGKILPKKKMFDSSFHTGSMPIKVTLGDKSLVEGWTPGLIGSCRGERRTVTIPAAMAFGESGSSKPKVPPDTDVVYMFEVIEISKSRRRAAADTEL